MSVRTLSAKIEMYKMFFLYFVTKHMPAFYTKLFWSNNQRCLFSQCSAGTTSSTCYQKSGPRRLFYFSAGQCASSQGQINHQNASKSRRDT